MLSAGGTLLAGRSLASGVGHTTQTVARPARTPNAHLRLSLNENAFGCSPQAVEAIRRGLTDLARYTEADAQALTAKIAAKEGVLPEQIVIGEVLPEVGLQLGLKGGPGGQFIYSQPGFTDLVLAAEQTGGTAVAVDLDDRLQNDLSAIKARVDANTRAVFIVNPHNPSGTISDNTTLRSFVSEVASRTAAAFLADGVDIGRSFPPLDRWARISIGLPEENERAITVLRKILRRGSAD